MLLRDARLDPIGRPCSRAAQAASDVELAFCGFGDITRDGIHVRCAVAADCCGVAFVIRENGFHGVCGDVAPVRVNEVAHAVAARARIREAMGFARGKFRGEIVVGVDDRIGVCIGEPRDAFGADFEIGDLAVAKQKTMFPAEQVGCCLRIRMQDAKLFCSSAMRLSG